MKRESERKKGIIYREGHLMKKKWENSFQVTFSVALVHEPSGHDYG